MENEIVNPEAAIPTEEQGVTATDAADVKSGQAENATTEGDAETAISEALPCENEGTAEPDFSLDVKYNKEKRSLTREEAVNFAEQGIFYDTTVKPIYNKLDYIAAQKNCTIGELLNGIIASDEENYRTELLQKFSEGDPVIDDLMKLYREKQKEKYDKVLSDRKAAEESAAEENRESIEARLAKEFVELKTEFPDVGEFSSLPDEVKTDAANGRDLLSAYLRYKHLQQKKTEAAQAAEKESAKASTGSVSSITENVDSAVSSFLAGLKSI